MITTVRLLQLPQNFLFDVVAKNKFVVESEELFQMVVNAVTPNVSGRPNRSDSSRAIRKEVYVFSSHGKGGNIMKYEFQRSLLSFN